MQRKPTLIVIHCSATPSGRSIARGTPGQPGYLNAAQVIDSWHAAKGFKRLTANRQTFNPTLPSIGYHFVIDVDGTSYTGRHLDEAGAHVARHNSHSIGICMVGGVEPKTAAYTVAQWATLARLLRQLNVQFGIPLQAPLRTSTTLVNGVCGHRDLSPDTNGNGTADAGEWLKTCPGFDVATYLAQRFYPAPAHVWRLPATPLAKG